MTRQVNTSTLALSAAALLGLATLALTRSRPRASAPRGGLPSVRAAKRLNRAAGTLAASVIADSAVEHYRGAFHNKAMVAPLLSASLSLLVSAHGNADHRARAHRVRDLVYGAAIFTGLLGTGFHVYNVGKRPGGYRWENFFYGAPLGAPGALLLSGAAGFLAERVRDTAAGADPRIAGLPAGRTVAGASALGLLVTAAEAALLHFRGAFHDPFMYLPVTVAPVSASLLGHAALGRSRPRHRLTRWWLRGTAVLGFLGAAFHMFGVARNMGGWRNWSQNLLNGPPIPAPPGFTGVALAGLAALGLMEDHAE
ncbi:MAG: hypothetical protein ACRETB_04120 [Steroidobacteraceae bacterium]